MSSNIEDEVELDNQYNIEQTYKEHISMKTVASTSYFRHWKNATTAFNNHQNSKTHNYSTISMSKFFDGNPIDVIIVKNKKLELSQRECKRLKIGFSLKD